MTRYRLVEHGVSDESRPALIVTNTFTLYTDGSVEFKNLTPEQADALETGIRSWGERVAANKPSPELLREVRDNPTDA